MGQRLRVLVYWGLLAGPVAAAVMSMACAESPSTPEASECQRNNSAKVTFENRTTNNRTYDVVWDGSRLTVLAPGQKSQEYDVEAGITHTLQFKFTNTGQPACSVSHPILVVCTTTNYWCTF